MILNDANFQRFSNPLFDDSNSSDDELSHEEVIHEMSFKTYSNPVFDLDEEIISVSWMFEASRARGFCPSFTRASNPQLHYGNPIS
ncbi:hypothetical protein Tco_0008788 [Tanacetum coccineum]